MKRIISIFLTLCILLCLSVSVFAVDTSRSYTFDLTANGAHEVSVKTGDVITVVLELKRTDKGAAGAMYAMQDEIDYDDTYLSLESSGAFTYEGCTATDIALAAGGRSHYFNFVSLGKNGANWSDSVSVGAFRLKVTYTGKATTKLKNCEYLVSTADGRNSYTATANDVTIYINGGAEDKGSDSSKLITSEHIAYVSGYADGTVRPNANITRAETAQMLYRLLTPETRNKNSRGGANFTDVANDAWYAASVRTLSNLGIIKGYNDGSFRPNANITRAEFAAMLCRFNNASGTAKTNFTDIAGHWARASIEAASAKGWVTGYADGTFRPNAKVTRAEVMAMLNRMLGRLPESKADLLASMTHFSDNSDAGVWYYLHVQEATNGHTYTMKADGVHETWVELK